MAEAHDSKGILYQNLVDAGLENEDVQRCISLSEEGRTDAFLRFLEEHRKVLMNSIHRQQKQVDCLDFLTYRISGGKKISSLKNH